MLGFFNAYRDESVSHESENLHNQDSIDFGFSTKYARQISQHDKRRHKVLHNVSGMELLPLLNGAQPPIPVLVFSSREMVQEDVQKVRSVLVKSRTDNTQLLTTIKRL